MTVTMRYSTYSKERLLEKVRDLREHGWWVLSALGERDKNVYMAFLQKNPRQHPGFS